MNMLKIFGKYNFMNNKLNEFIATLNKSIITWDYFSDFNKASKNIFRIKIQLNILNSLLGESCIKDKFFKIIDEYPEVREVLPILIATRKEKLKEMPIINSDSLIVEDRSYLFDKKIQTSNSIKNDLWYFIVNTGLIEIFKNNKIKNLEDYVFGVEVGLDSNARKNRTGKLMENVVEKFVSDFCSKNKLEYIPQATKTKIFDKFGIEIKMDVDNKKRGERKFDFAIFNKTNKKLTIIETNYYGSTGSKPSSIAREYIDLEKILIKENIRFIWVTDGLGWKKMQNPLGKTINENKHVINLTMLKNGVLDDIFNK